MLVPTIHSFYLCYDDSHTILGFDKMFQLDIKIKNGELFHATIVEDGTTTIYEHNSDCMCCDRWRLVSMQTGCCFECDHQTIVRKLKILLGLDSDSPDDSGAGVF